MTQGGLFYHQNLDQEKMFKFDSIGGPPPMLDYNGNNIMQKKLPSSTLNQNLKNNVFVYNANKEDPTGIHIDRNVLIEPSSSSSLHKTYLKTSPPRTPSPNMSDGDSGYSSKQMSPVSLVSIF